METRKLTEGKPLTFPAHTAQVQDPGTIKLSELSGLWTVESLAQQNG